MEYEEGYSTMTVTDEVRNRLGEIVASSNKDMDWAEETYEEKMEEMQDKHGDGVPEDALQNHAVRMVRSEIVSNSRMGGEVQECDILAIGHGGYREWSDGDGGSKQVLLSYGVVNPPDDPAGIAVFINDETTGVDLGNIQDAFQPLNNLTGWYNVGESDELRNTYILNSTDRTKVEVEESDMSKQEKREFLHQFTEEVQVANIAEGLSTTDDQGRAVNFGADVKRINATVVDWNKGDNASVYTLLDDSVVDPSELGDQIVSERARTPGLTAWCPDDYMQYGVNSQLEVYGSVSRMQSGQIVMNVFGIVPLIPMEMTVEDGANEENVKEETI